MKKKRSSVCRVILAATAGLYSCNSANGNKATRCRDQQRQPDQTRELSRQQYPGCDDCHSPKIVGPNIRAYPPLWRTSGQQPASKPNTSVMKGFGRFFHDLTSAVGPWGTILCGQYQLG